jgi:hypothetical protein
MSIHDTDVSEYSNKSLRFRGGSHLVYFMVDHRGKEEEKKAELLCFRPLPVSATPLAPSFQESKTQAWGCYFTT